MRIIGNIAIADLQVLLRDAEDIIPYDWIAVVSLYIQQDYDLNIYRTILSHLVTAPFKRSP